MIHKVFQLPRRITCIIANTLLALICSKNSYQHRHRHVYVYHLYIYYLYLHFVYLIHSLASNLSNTIRSRPGSPIQSTKTSKWCWLWEILNAHRCGLLGQPRMMGRVMHCWIVTSTFTRLRYRLDAKEVPDENPPAFSSLITVLQHT